MTSTVETVLVLHREERNGDILVFLTGQEEVETSIAQLRWDRLSLNRPSTVRAVVFFIVESMLVGLVKECSC